jgi:zinc protease
LAALDAELDRLKSIPISEQEIARAVKQVRALFSYGSESITNQAFWMGYTEMFASHAWFLQFLENLQQVTAADVMRVAGQYFKRENRVVGFFKPVEAA